MNMSILLDMMSSLSKKRLTTVYMMSMSMGDYPLYTKRRIKVQERYLNVVLHFTVVHVTVMLFYISQSYM